MVCCLVLSHPLLHADVFRFDVPVHISVLVNEAKSPNKLAEQIRKHLVFLRFRQIVSILVEVGLEVLAHIEHLDLGELVSVSKSQYESHTFNWNVQAWVLVLLK